MKHTEKILNNYRHADSDKRNAMWIQFTKMREQFTELEKNKKNQVDWNRVKTCLPLMSNFKRKLWW